jgi:hypothetical protein
MKVIYPKDITTIDFDVEGYQPQKRKFTCKKLVLNISPT